jgi:hypothetical protein
MKGRFAKLSINAYDSRFDQSASNNLKFASCTYYCSADAPDIEKRIHRYFDE